MTDSKLLVNDKLQQDLRQLEVGKVLLLKDENEVRLLFEAWSMRYPGRPFDLDIKQLAVGKLVWVA